MKLLTSISVFAMATLLFAGCASSGYKQGNKAASSIQASADGIAALQGHMNQTLIALNALVDSPQADLRPQFKELDSKISGLESAAKDVANERIRMGEQTKKYLADWDAELGQMQNADIKARSQTRKEAVARQIDAVKRSYSEFDVAFRPFMADLQDVRKYLSVDLTRSGLASIKEPAVKANTDATPLRDAIVKLAADFKALSASMSSITPQQSK
jgi:hypothetical protein